MASSSPVVVAGVSGVVGRFHEESHVLKIHGYSKTKALNNGEHIKSGTFSVGGHTWCIEYYPDGNMPVDAGWISLALTLEKNSEIEVEASFSFSLLEEDMEEPAPAYQNGWSKMRAFSSISTIEWKNTFGCARFIERKTLEELSYIKDDCFRVTCDVKVLTYPNPFVTVPPPDMHQQIGRLLSASSQVEADITFQVGVETFTAHRLVLAARSPVFMAELFGSMKESNIHIRIDDMEARVFKAMLHFIYTDTLADVERDEDLQMAQHLLVAAARYDIQRLKLMCEDKLCNNIGISTVATYLALAEKHGCRGLKEACFEFLSASEDMEAIMTTDGVQHLASSYPSLLKEMIAKLC